MRNWGFENQDAFLSWLDSLVTFLVKEGFENNINREKNTQYCLIKKEFSQKKRAFVP